MTSRLELIDLRASRERRPILDSISLKVEGGEVLALIGERRAGKSTLIQALAGHLRPDSGTLLVDGRSPSGKGPAAFLKLGVGVLSQESSLIPSLNAPENVLAGRARIGVGGRSGLQAAEARIDALAERWGLRLDSHKPVRYLTKLESAIVELARALAFEPAVLALDEPTCRFTADEMQVLYAVIAEARGAGRAILYAASTVDEVFRIADRVSILKGGRLHETLDVRLLERERLVDLAYSFSESREELLSKNIELVKYKRYNEEIISNLPLGSVVLDAGGMVYLANTAARAALGVGPEATDLDSLLAAVDPSARFEIIAHAFEGHRSEWERVPMEGGRVVQIATFPFHDGDGHALGSILVVDEITEKLAAREYLARAEHAASVAELAAGVAHEVNNPLAIIANYVELLIMRPQEPYCADRLAIIRDEIKRIQRIVVSLLSFSKVSDSCLEETDLAEVARDSLLLLSHEAERRGITLDSQLPTGRLLVIADASRIKQVIINLVVNALEALPEGGRILVSLQSGEGGEASRHALLMVEDNGPGLPATILSELYRPFARSEKGKAHAGLGLSVCKHIAEAHDGSITCESRAGLTRFTIELPIVSHSVKART
jgi:two-component system sensor histidine kinase AtoS